MRGAQSPGGSGPRFRTRRVYTMRRILVALAVLLLLALLVPRACQAIIGSDNNAGSNRGQGTPEKAAAGAGNAKGTTAEKAEAKGGDETGKQGGAPAGEASRNEESGGPEKGTDTDLGKVLTESAAVGVAEPEGRGGDPPPAPPAGAGGDAAAPRGGA